MNQELKERASLAFRAAADIMRRVHIAFFVRESCSTSLFLAADANYYHASEMLRHPTPESVNEIEISNAALRARLEKEESNAPVCEKSVS